MTDNRRENTQWTDKKCWDISLTTPLSIQKGRRDGTRKGPSSLENMPFLLTEESPPRGARGGVLTRIMYNILTYCMLQSLF